MHVRKVDQKTGEEVRREKRSIIIIFIFIIIIQTVKFIYTQQRKHHEMNHNHRGSNFEIPPPPHTHTGRHTRGGSPPLPATKPASQPACQSTRDEAGTPAYKNILWLCERQIKINTYGGKHKATGEKGRGEANDKAWYGDADKLVEETGKRQRGKMGEAAMGWE